MTQRLFCALAVVIASLNSAPVAADIAIGFANPLSGPYAASGSRNREAVTMAVDHLNAQGGVLGEQVRLVVADDVCDLDQAVLAARKLVAAGVRLVVGHMCSHASLMAAGIYETFDVIMISPDSTHPRLTEEGRRNVFRLIGRDDRQGAFAGDFLARDYRERNIAIVHDGTVYGRGLANETRRRLRDLGLIETLFSSYSPDAESYHDLARRLCSSDADVVYVGGYGPDAARILLAARALGDDLQLVGGDGLDMDEFWTIAREIGEGTVFSARAMGPLAVDPAGLRAAFRAAGGEGPGTGGMAAYAAVELWAQAVERGGSDKLPVVASELRRGRFNTVLGRIAFDTKGDLRGAAWEMRVWTAGDHAVLDQEVAESVH